jgi:hypothetical protein
LESALFGHGGVNLRIHLCGAPLYASAQILGFLAMAKNDCFQNLQATYFHPDFMDSELTKTLEIRWVNP